MNNIKIFSAMFSALMCAAVFALIVSMLLGSRGHFNLLKFENIILLLAVIVFTITPILVHKFVFFTIGFKRTLFIVQIIRLFLSLTLCLCVLGGYQLFVGGYLSSPIGIVLSAAIIIVLILTYSFFKKIDLE